MYLLYICLSFLSFAVCILGSTFFEDLGPVLDPLFSCEGAALKYGSEIADEFNLLSPNFGWSERLHQELIVEKLGFVPWITRQSETIFGNKTHEIHQKLGWVGRKIENSPYSMINHKWIYFYGDSTLRQIWATYGAPFKDNDFERNAKEWSRHYCNGQTHRKRHPKGGVFPEEGWSGPCGVNEVTCHIAGYGDAGLLTFDWKHFPYEDYDQFMFGEHGPWVKGFEGENRRPDLLAIQFGLHTCAHGIGETYDNGYLNETFVDTQRQEIWKFMEVLRQAIDNPKVSFRVNPTTVVILATGSAGSRAQKYKTDQCVQMINEEIFQAAHAFGFAVLDRYEIERRLLRRSLYSKHAYLIDEMHLFQPAQSLVSTSLLYLYTCLNHYNISRGKLPEEKNISYPLQYLYKTDFSADSRPNYNP